MLYSNNQQEVFFDNLENLCCCQFQVIKSRVASKEKWSISFSKKENVPNFLCLVTCCPLVHPAKPTSRAPNRRRSLLKFKTDPSVSLLPWTKPPSIMFQENGASLFEAANIKSLVASWNVKSNQRRRAKTKFEMGGIKRNFESFPIKDIFALDFLCWARLHTQGQWTEWWGFWRLTNGLLRASHYQRMTEPIPSC